MKKLVVITMALIATFGMFSANAQQITPKQYAHGVKLSIPEVALLDLETESDAITLTPTAPTEAGEAFDFSSATDESTWINYSSVVAATKARSVSVAITSGTVPEGLFLTVAASSEAGNGKGNVGSPVGDPITLTASAQTLINSVKSCWTGTGINNGHKLTYQLDLVDADQYGSLANADTDLTITYTISDDI